MRRATVIQKITILTIAISIHALLAESDREPTALRTPHHKFLSTLSLRRATRCRCRPVSRDRNFYPRSPCGERHDYEQYYIRARGISIHALLAESDAYTNKQMEVHTIFLSTLSLRRATVFFFVCCIIKLISIHALLAESDSKKNDHLQSTNDFYPRSPCGERLFANFDGFFWWVISIHALLAESDSPLSASIDHAA